MAKIRPSRLRDRKSSRQRPSRCVHVHPIGQNATKLDGRLLLHPQKTLDDLEWVLFEKSHLNIGQYITNKQEHASDLGSSCDIFTAWSTKHNTKVAVKRIRAFLLEDKKFAKRLAREIRIWASLKHENVLPLLGYFVEGDNLEKKLPNLVSEWMARGSLHVYISAFPSCGFDTLKLLSGIISGLKYLHAQDVIHGDLKSHNILLNAEGNPLLADFGLSHVLKDSMATTATTSPKGSLRWMAPELLIENPGDESNRHTKMSDMWAFGMLLYELLSWTVPYFDKRGDHLVILAIMNGELPAKLDVRAYDDPHIFKWIWTCCNTCWRRDPTSRPTAPLIGHLLPIVTYQAQMAEFNRLTVNNHLYSFDLLPYVENAFNVDEYHSIMEDTTDFTLVESALEVGLVVADPPNAGITAQNIKTFEFPRISDNSTPPRVENDIILSFSSSGAEHDNSMITDPPGILGQLKGIAACLDLQMERMMGSPMSIYNGTPSPSLFHGTSSPMSIYKGSPYLSPDFGPNNKHSSPMSICRSSPNLSPNFEPQQLDFKTRPFPRDLGA